LENDGMLVSVPVPAEVAEAIERLAEAAQMHPVEFLSERLLVVLQFVEQLMAVTDNRRPREVPVPGYL
jgi:hypothetical protein